MEGVHFHLGIEHLVLGALGVFAVAHVGRWIGTMLGKTGNGSGVVSTVGKATGSFFTLSGAQ